MRVPALHTLSVAALALALSAPLSAMAEVYPKDTLQSINKPQVAGGVGVLHGLFAFTRDKAPADWAMKEISWLTLAPGDSVGYHKHESNEDAYIIVSGTGTFMDADGKDVVVKAGDITIVRKGQSHGIRNTGNVPLVFLDVIAQQ